MKKAIWGVLLLALTGCVSSDVVNTKISRKFVGQNIDKFFIEHGGPANRHQMNSGQILWTWDSGVQTVHMPSNTTVTGSSYGGYANYNAITTGGGSMSLQCVVQIISEANGTITQIRILRDTIGHWTTSMCHEVLKYS